MANLRIIDRRQNPTGKSLGNRQRFMDRAREQLRKAIKDNIRQRSISDTTSGETVVIPADGTHEPVFRHDPETGERSRVLPGNKEFRAGDRIPRPSGGAGRGGSEGSEEGEGEDAFAFTLSRDEFLDLLFEDLKLPELVKKQLKSEESDKPQRAGFATSGPANRLNMVRTLRRSLVRRAALSRPKQAAIEQMERELERLENGEITPSDGQPVARRMAQLREQLARARQKRSRVPFIDPIDLRYNRLEHRPQPIAQAVMFCLMDVSASMDEDMKALAKRFFLLLHLFLERHYDNVDVVFIRHTQHAEEVDEQTFFEGRQTGGTVVSSALKEMLRIAGARYPLADYNIYVAQASDGDNVRSDIETCVNLLNDRVLPITQYMAYVEINQPARGRRNIARQGESDLWHGYAQLADRRANLAMRRISESGDIFPVFRDLFKSEGQQS
ncbi:MAG: YeaH/YhbH family protein [Dichotomicrobium sp.]